MNNDKIIHELDFNKKSPTIQAGGKAQKVLTENMIDDKNRLKLYKFLFHLTTY